MKNCPVKTFSIMKLFISKISLLLFINTFIVKCETECPINRPIYNNSTNSCVLEYCTNEQLNNKECIISNNIIKKQWINNILTLAKSNNPLYPTIAKGNNKDILFESNIDKNEKIFYSIEQDGRGYLDESQLIHIKIDSNNLFNTYGNSYLFTLQDHKYFLKLSFYESIEIYDLVDKKYKNYKLENLLGKNHIQSYYNSLLRINEDNTFIYAYITTGNFLAMQKIKIVSNNFNNANFIEIKKTLIEKEKTISKNSRRCLITDNQYIECLDMDEEQIFYVRLYDINLNFIKKFKFEKNKAPPNRAFSTYHEAIFFKNEISIFIYYTDISNNKAKPIVSFNKLQNNNLVYFTDSINKCTLFTNESFNSYYFSDTDNSFTILNDHYFALASITTYSNQRLIIALFNLFNEDKTLRIHYFNVPLNDLYNINYYSNLNSFYYNDFIGVQFVQLTKNNNKDNYINSILLFSYVNSTDPSPVINIFEKYNNTNIYSINLSNYIHLQNNIFCYVLTGIKIISLPGSNTNIKITKKGSNTQLKSNDVIGINENITISNSSKIENVLKGNYYIVFEPTLEEPPEEEFTRCQFCLYDYLGEKINVNWSPDKFTGRKTKFIFTVGNCYKNCGTCVNEGTEINDQKCETCIEGYYFEENTKNCYKSANEKHYFNKNKSVFSQCYKVCYNCSDINTNENKHNCLSCKKNYLLYNNTNCLSCKYNNLYTNYEQTSCLQVIPLGYYLNNTIYNTIDKCHENCLSCNKGPDIANNNMNCIYCDNQKGFYLLENTNNCYKLPYEGYFLDEDYKIKKCYYACKTCSAGPIMNSNGEIENMNCDTCNNELGYYKVDSNSKNCEFKERIGEYYNSKDNKYYPCYRACLTCFNKEDSTLKMNCLTCNENNGFFLYTKNGNNCLNCKINGHYINYNENECLDEIPEGYYLRKDGDNMIDICYSKCKTCSKKGSSDEDMKCDSCPESYFLENNNCVQDMTCSNSFFFYKINIKESIYLKEKNCLTTKNNCPEILPFYYTNTKECIDICPIDFIFSQGCKIAKSEKGINQLLFILENEYAKGKMQNFNKIMKFSENFQNFLINFHIFPFLFKSKINDDDKLRRRLSEENGKIQNIDNDDNFILDENNFLDEVEINLDECLDILKNNSIIDNNTNLTMIKIDLKNINMSEHKYYFELFNDNNRLQKIDLSLCNNKTITIKVNIDKELTKLLRKKKTNYTNIYDQCYVDNKEGADVLIEDRIINSTSNYKYDIKDIISDQNFASEIGYKCCPLKCSLIKVDYNSKFVYCSCPYNNGDNGNIKIELTKRRIEIEVNNNKRFLNTKNLKRNVKSVTYSNSQSNLYVLKCINNISKNFGQNYILIIFTLLYIAYIAMALIYFVKYRKEFIKNIESTKKLQRKLSLSGTFKLAGPPKFENRVSKNHITLTSLNSDMKMSHNNIIKYNIRNNINKNKFLTLTNDNYYYSNNNIKCIDLDLLDYNLAIDNDKRTNIEIFLSISQKRQMYIFCFIKDHNIRILKMSLIIFCFINYFAVNLFFFNNKVIHKIYIDKGKYNFGYQIKYVFLSALISCIFLYIAQYIFIFKKSQKPIIQIIKCIDASLIVLISIFLFYWIYIGSFCSVFIKTQKHLIINFFLTIIVSAIYELILTVISCALRRIAINKKNYPKMYKISVLLVSLKA